MRQRKYTLPRHTNLARQGSRTGAFFIDLAVFGAFTLVFLFGCFQFIFNPVAKPYKTDLEKEQLNSHLRSKDEKGELQIISQEASYEEFRDVISYYYMNYLTGEVSEAGTGSPLADEKIKLDSGEEVSKKDFYTVEWFNKEVLNIKTDNPENESTTLFTYVKVGDTYDKTQLGVPKESSLAEDVNIYMQNAYNTAYLGSFNNLSYIVSLTNKMTFIYSIELVLSALVSATITYVVFPLIFKKGRTIGKKVFKLALANSDGYSFENRQLAMRIMPLAVMILAFLIPIWNDLFLIILIPMIVFLVSFALAMASPKRASLHDFTARTIVIDDQTSIIFDNEFEEEKYTAKEDNLPPPEEENFGEEPEIRYEK